MRTYYTALDGLRAVAVGLVLLAHGGSPFPRSGGVGVDIFFVLSGFLITSILSDESRKHGRINRKNFFVRRFLRLTPCLVLTTVLFTVLYFVEHKHFPWIIDAISLTYFANWARALFYYDLSSMEHTWSLAIEEQYYLLWPSVIALVSRTTRSNRKSFWTLLAFAAALALYRTLMVGKFSSVRINFGLDTHMDGLVAGSALSYLVAWLDETGPDHTKAYKALSYLFAPLSVVGLITVMALITWTSPWMGRVGYAFVAGAASITILDLVASPFSLLKRFLVSVPLVYLGRISYGIYLLHLPIYRYVDFLLGRSFPGALPIKICVSVAAAALSYCFVESRFLLLKKRFHAGSAVNGLATTKIA